jgi:hypothetical protein
MNQSRTVVSVRECRGLRDVSRVGSLLYVAVTRGGIENQKLREALARPRPTVGGWHAMMGSHSNSHHKRTGSGKDRGQARQQPLVQ